MITIKYILGAWLNGSQNFEQGVDILQRLTTDVRLVAHLRKFQSDMCKRRLHEEIEKLYNTQKKPVSVPQDESMETLGAKLDMVDEWVNGEQGYYAGTKILEKLGADPGVVDFFMNHISDIGISLLQKEMLELHQDLTRMYKEERQRNAPPITTKDVLSYWLSNSDQDYTEGVNLFSALSDDQEKVSFFRSDCTPFRRMLLVEYLEKIYKDMIAVAAVKPTSVAEEQPPAPRPRNAELEVAATHKTTQLYKQVMNDQAALSNLTKVEGDEDVNNLDLIPDANYDVSQAYDDPAQGKEHGRLPDSEEEEELQEENVPDLKVKQTIDNLRKALSKLRGKEQTPERVALAQRHEARLQALLPRWESLKQAT